MAISLLQMTQQNQLPNVDVVFHISPELREIYNILEGLQSPPPVNIHQKIVTPICRIRKKKLPISGEYGDKVRQVRGELKKRRFSMLLNPHQPQKLHLEESPHRHECHSLPPLNVVQSRPSATKTSALLRQKSEKRQEEVASYVHLQKKGTFPEDIDPNETKRTGNEDYNFNLRIKTRMGRKSSYSNRNVVPTSREQNRSRINSLDRRYIKSQMQPIASMEISDQELECQDLGKSRMTELLYKFESPEPKFLTEIQQNPAPCIGEAFEEFKQLHSHMFIKLADLFHRKRKVSFIDKIYRPRRRSSSMI